MKTIGLVFLAALLITTGCASGRGGNGDQYDAASSGPIPGNGTVRPGMNPADIRDPASVTRPYEPRPTSPP